MNDKIIAIDGTAASGKGTLAKQLARALGFSCLDTGKLYRYVGYSLAQNGQDPADETAAIHAVDALKDTLSPEDLHDPALESDEAGHAASLVGAIPGVRSALLDFQRHFAQNPAPGFKGTVLDGRDIGTVVCPDAPLKLYVDADIEIRAQRRFKELQSKGISATYDAVLAKMRERDARDAGRDTAPMKPADDAIMLDTSTMSIEDVLSKALDLAHQRFEI
ncbi:MAG: (d)CMP kinase [Rhodospirillales bacterium]|nr:(d)CMP kinase [Rhodospirillales bacterium]MCB9996095.1 (d)CMP kinase [Rhodospirillales bacterium]